MSEILVPQSNEVDSYEKQVHELFDKAVDIVKTINSWPDHDVPDEGLYQTLKIELYSIASELGYDIGSPDSRKKFHNTLWRYQNEGVLDYQINSPAEVTSRPNQDTISAEVSTLLNNTLLTLNTLDFNDNAQTERFIEDLEFIAVLLGFDISSKESMLEFTKLLDILKQEQEHIPLSSTSFGLAA